MLKSYKKITYKYIQKKFNCSDSDLMIEKIIFGLITDKKINGRINDIN
jgi:hypothetical protein